MVSRTAKTKAATHGTTLALLFQPANINDSSTVLREAQSLHYPSTRARKPTSYQMYSCTKQPNQTKKIRASPTHRTTQTRQITPLTKRPAWCDVLGVAGMDEVSTMVFNTVYIFYLRRLIRHQQVEKYKVCLSVGWTSRLMIKRGAKQAK